MVQNSSFLMNGKVRNIAHDFRVAIFTFNRPFSDVSDFNFNAADIILYPSAVTDVNWSISVGPGQMGSGSFGMMAGFSGSQISSPTGAIVYSESGELFAEVRDDYIKNVLGEFDTRDVESRNKKVGDLFSNIKNHIKPMDYVVVYSIDIHTGKWHNQAENISQASPVFIGVVSDINNVDNIAANSMRVSVQFKSLLRLLDLGRFATSKSIIPVLEGITGRPFGESAENIFLGAKNVFSNSKPNEILKSIIAPWYPASLSTNRIELDNSRAEAQTLSWENFVYTSLMGNFNYDTILNKLRQFASNKDFEFYAEETGEIVWKLPTYARGINKQAGNFVTQDQFDPQNADRYDNAPIYHLNDVMNVTFRSSEAEIVNVISGSNDAMINGLESIELNSLLEPMKRTFYIKGGDDDPERNNQQFGFMNVGVRPIALQNPIHYNAVYLASKSNSPTLRIYGQDTNTTLTEAQVMYYMFKAYKLNISRYYTASVGMIDDLNIKVGMPCIITKYAEVGSGSNKGQLVPSIYYISALSRQYQAGKAPILSLSLTHGRFADEEFHNGIHLFGHLSSWCARTEGGPDESSGLFSEVYQRPINQIVSPTLIPPTPGNSLDVLNFTLSDKRVRDIMTEQDKLLSKSIVNLRNDLRIEIDGI